jgi:hypothetical protein
MQRIRLKLVVVAVLIILNVLLGFKGSVWASPDQSPPKQTIPPRPEKIYLPIVQKNVISTQLLTNTFPHQISHRR